MKTVLAVLFGAYFALLAHPLWAATVNIFEVTDGDVDAFVIEGGLNEGQFLAITRPDELPGAFWSLDLSTYLSGDQVVTTDLLGTVLSNDGIQFSIALWDSVNWHFPDVVTPVGKDGLFLEWVYDHGVVDQTSYTGVSLLTVDTVEVSAVPLPASVWLFGSGLLGVLGIARHGHPS